MVEKIGYIRLTVVEIESKPTYTAKLHELPTLVIFYTLSKKFGNLYYYNKY